MSTAVSTFRWGVAGVSIPLPPSRQPIPVQPVAWDNLTFTPGGAYDLRRHLGVTFDELGRFNRSRNKFEAADLAWLAAGASDDGRHSLPSEQFYPEFHDLYDSVPTGVSGQQARRDFSNSVRALIWDLATQWDRATGGTTLILHTSGTTVPGSPLVPERMKSQVYIQPRFLHEHPETHATIAFLVQTFLEHIAIPTAQDWRARASRLWSLLQTSHLPAMQLPATLIPEPSSLRSAHYVFKGRPWGSLQLEAPLPAPTPPPPATASPPDEDDVYDIEDITFDADALALITAVERAEHLEHENAGLRELIESLQSTNTDLLLDAKDRKLRLPPRSTPVRPSTPVRSPPPYVGSALSPRSFATSSTASASRTLAHGLQSPSAHGLQSPSLESATSDLLSPLTDEFLADHALTHLAPAVNLILRIQVVFKWSQEVSRLPGVPSELVDGLLEAMDKDRIAAL
ncbi:hypothetical protein B0H16DRAFT_1741035 [Mycena metata]|uniref:Uncharacterized protein n=1 Tax=Mycena metata TaxID=1033252 RepID=A0AAD7HCI7_9AGAR|nr:hypothetical protein B0H16DRAFT_1741035 [Mycena metata]